MSKQTKKLKQKAVNKLKKYREEIKHAHPDQMIEDSTKLLHQARKERTQQLEDTLNKDKNE